MSPDSKNVSLHDSIINSPINPKMTKSATGNHISPTVMTSINCDTTTLTPVLTTVTSTTQSTNFPRGTRNRQTFHGKTEHTKVSAMFIYSAVYLF